MKKIVFGYDMKKIDNYTINETGIMSLVLMERAAYEVFLNMKKDLKDDTRILVVCGTGNNGADGIALSRILLSKKYKCSVFVAGDVTKQSKEFEIQYNILKKMYPECIKTKVENIYNIIVDSIFGVGLSRNIEGNYKKVIEKINEFSYQSKIYAVDIPSGVNSTMGSIMGVSIKANETITFGAYKSGMLLYPGAEFCGKITVSDIGFDDKAYELLSYNMFTYDMEDLKKIIPQRKNDSNKGTYGKILIIAGSKNMAGAAFLSSLACYKSGAGIVKIFTHKNNRDFLLNKIPEAIIETYGDEDIEDDKIENIMKYGDTIIIGPGLGTGKVQKKLVKYTLNTHKKILIDADALNILSEDKELCKKLNYNCVITPHIVEMSRLTKKTVEFIKNNPIEVAKDFAKEYNVNVVLKDARTVVTNGKEFYINICGNNGMSTGGSGDALSGIAGAFISAEKDTFKMSTAAVFVHSLCGDSASKKKSQYSLMARDLINELDCVLD